MGGGKPDGSLYELAGQIHHVPNSGHTPVRHATKAEVSRRFVVTASEHGRCREFVAWFNAACFRHGLRRRARPTTENARRLARVTRQGYTLRQAKLVVVYALRGPEGWISSERMRPFIALRTLLKQYSSTDARCFEDYLEAAESWALETWGDDALEGADV